jgi:hypothetical protein
VVCVGVGEAVGVDEAVEVERTAVADGCDTPVVVGAGIVAVDRAVLVAAGGFVGAGVSVPALSLPPQPHSPVVPTTIIVAISNRLNGAYIGHPPSALMCCHSGVQFG